MRHLLDKGKKEVIVLDKKFITTIVLEHEIDDEKKNTIFIDLGKRLTPEGKVPITIDSITIQEAPASMQPDYYKRLLALAQEYQQQAAEQQYEEPQQTDEIPTTEEQPATEQPTTTEQAEQE